MDDSKDPEEKKEIRQVGVFITIPFVLAVPPVLGWFFGKWLDDHLGTQPYLMFIFILLGFAAGFRELFHILKRFMNGS